jgi:hypothetical protein
MKFLVKSALTKCLKIANLADSKIEEETKVDNWICDRAQEFSDFMQRNFGITPRIISITCIAIYSILAITEIMIINKTATKPLTWLVLAFQLGIAAFFYWEINRTHDRAERDTLMGLRNPYRISGFESYIRLSGYLFLAIRIFDLIKKPDLQTSVGVARIIFYIAFLLFIACTPLPPGASRLRKWWDSLAESKAVRATN